MRESLLRRLSNGVIKVDSNQESNQDGRGDSTRIQTGDSGGAALTCTKDGKVAYVGAISYILENARDESDPANGLTGGVASAIPSSGGTKPIPPGLSSSESPG